MLVDTNIHLDGLPVLSIQKGEHFIWIVLEDGDKGAMRIFSPNHNATTEDKLRRAVDAFNRALSDEQPPSLTIEAFPLNAAE